MLNILPLAVLRTNYVWVIQDSDTPKVAIVDPGEAQPVLDYLATNSLELSCILVTHHHEDHTGGIADILDKFPVPVYGPTGKNLVEGETITLPSQKITLTVTLIPGHTLDHVAYYNDDMLFSGDTLFSAGCGRVFEGTHAQMLTSLNKLKALPNNPKLYCGHEYTVENLKFASIVEPNNLEVQKRLTATQELTKNNIPTLPSTMADELATNPFLRVSKLDDFVKIRDLKDDF